jgi:hypothetical protein
MTQGKAPTHEDLYRSSADFCEGRLAESSIYRILHRDGHRLFADEMFADLFQGTGRRSVPSQIVATVMVLQRVEGLSDREAVDRFTFDLRWKYAAGGLEFDRGGFVHTVLVDMRVRLAKSERPNRIFEAVLDVAKQAGLVGRKRVLDSTALYDAVATQDTVTLIRGAIRAVLAAAGTALAADLRSVLRRDDDYATAGKPVCDWDDAVAREALVDALVRDGSALVAKLDGCAMPVELSQAMALLTTVIGQDVEQREDGVFRIVRGVAEDRVISTVDPEARHGHKTESRGFDGYKGHLAIDPDSEIITATQVTAGNVADGQATEALLADVLRANAVEPAQAGVSPPDGAAAIDGSSTHLTEANTAPATTHAEAYGDASYGTADIVERLQSAGVEANVKVQLPAARKGMFSQDAFTIDTTAKTVTCPAGVLVQLHPRKDGAGHADFGASCAGCSKRDQCTTSKTSRQINVHSKHDTLHRERTRQRDESWKRRYRATRPKVERKIAHLMRRRHGGRRARVRGSLRVGHDFALLAAATNLQRLAALAVRWVHGAWARPTAQ